MWLVPVRVKAWRTSGGIPEASPITRAFNTDPSGPRPAWSITRAMALRTRSTAPMNPTCASRSTTTRPAASAYALHQRSWYPIQRRASKPPGLLKLRTGRMRLRISMRSPCSTGADISPFRVTRSSPATRRCSRSLSARSARRTNRVRLSNSSGRASTTPVMRQRPVSTRCTGWSSAKCGWIQGWMDRVPSAAHRSSGETAAGTRRRRLRPTARAHAAAAARAQALRPGASAPTTIPPISARVSGMSGR